MLDRLEAEGLLGRERVATDRRGAYAVLTERGQDALRAAWPVYARGIQAHFAGHLDDDEVRVPTAAFGRIDAAARARSSSLAVRVHALTVPPTKGADISRTELSTRGRTTAPQERQM